MTQGVGTRGTGKVDGRRARGQTTRNAALKAAAELFATHGYSSTSISSIAEAAGVRSASLYHAFGSKEGLLAAVAEQAASEFFEQLDVLVDVSEPSRAVARLADSFERNPLFLRLQLILVLERGDEDPELLRSAVAVREQARRMVAGWLSGHLRPTTSDTRAQALDDVSRVFMAFMDGAFIARQVDADATAYRRMFELMAELLMSALATESA